jgi:ribosomal-protein-alanine N-acetyltransferase
MGLCPDRTGQGQGAWIIREVIEFAQQNFQAQKLRATVAAFNQRALRAWKKVGFYAVSEFVRPSDNQRFAILIRNG